MPSPKAPNDKEANHLKGFQIKGEIEAAIAHVSRKDNT